MNIRVSVRHLRTNVLRDIFNLGYGAIEPARDKRRGTRATAIAFGDRDRRVAQW